MHLPPGSLTDFGPVPDGWLWGVATSSHQVEGGNVANDWWRWEHNPDSPATESSGDACDSWHRWAEDLALVTSMGLDAYRFSLEWSRIEPAEGEVSLAALDRYRAMLSAAREAGLTTVVTVTSFTLPAWLAVRGGWLSADAPRAFARYCATIAAHLGDLIDVAFTMNEPNSVAGEGFVSGAYPPGKANDVDGLRRATAALVEAHQRGRDALASGPGGARIGLSVALQDVVIHPDGDARSDGVRRDEVPPPDEDQVAHLLSAPYLDAARDDDFVGVQTYLTQHVGAHGRPLDLPTDWRLTSMGYPFSPEAVAHTVPLAHRHTGVPVIASGTGISTLDEAERIEYFSRFLTSLRGAMQAGADVRGFFAWCLLDGFEWTLGFDPTFGLHSVDPATFERTPKESAHWYRDLVAATRTRRDSTRHASR